MSDCPDMEALEAFADGSDDDTVASHVQRCESCREQLSEIEANQHFLTSLGDSIQTVRMEPSAPTRIGRFRISGEPCLGGQGVVYRGLDEVTGHEVAVKLLLQGAMATPTQRLRFEREIELMRLLDHPSIVSIVGSGRYERGVYLATPWIEGRPFGEVFPPGTGDLGRGLETLARIADAVSHAHQRGVLHRDLKPSNILIDGEGRAHVLDFGLGAAPGDDGVRAITRASFDRPMGTLAYMAPEQAAGRWHDVGTRSDQYALGAMAYELIAGRLPIPMDTSYERILDKIRSHDPSPPSQIRSRTHQGEAPDRGLWRARARLDAVVLKALEKDPANRYETCRAFARDLRRAMRGQTVDAHRRGPVQRAFRAASRRPAISGTVAGAVLLLLVISGIALIRVSSARERAEAAEVVAAAQAQSTSQVNDFLIGLFDELDLTQPADIKLLTGMLQRGESQYASAQIPPDTRRRTAIALAQGWKKLGRFDRATRILRGARTLTPLPDPRLGAEVAAELAGALHGAGDYDESITLYREAIGLLPAEPRNRVQRASLDLYLASVLIAVGDDEGLAEAFDRLDDAEQLIREGSPKEDELLASIFMTRGWGLHSSLRFADAIPWYRESIRIRRELGQTGLALAEPMMLLGGALEGIRDKAGAAEMYRQVNAIYESSLGEEHPLTAKGWHQMARFLFESMEETEESERLARRAAQVRAAIHGPEHSTALQSRTLLGAILVARGEYEEAEPLLRDAVARWADTIGMAEQRMEVKPWGPLAELLAATGRPEEAAAARAEADAWHNDRSDRSGQPEAEPPDPG
jgi:tetratricopeptide (TPR) repeat protein